MQLFIATDQNSSVKEVYEMVARQHDLKDDDFYLYSSGE